MKSLIVDAAKDKIFLKIITKDQSYTNEYSNSRENFHKFSHLIFDFLEQNDVMLSQITNIFVNYGPGNYTSIRSSLAICKAMCLANNIDLYGFNNTQLKNNNYNKILDLFQKGVLIKGMIKPIYKN
tara:strand:- start:253 stop:630 length:378 start_codon:yes stop_codon:yes gene_type:complete